MKKNFFCNIFYLLIIFFLPLNNYAITEMTGEFIYTKTVYGENRQNSIRYRRYGLVLVQYIFYVTGIELNYTQLSEVTTENTTLDTGTSFLLSGLQNKSITINQGIGLRQALAPYGSLITPSISVGYAKQIKNSKTTYTISDGYQTRQIEIYHGEIRNNAVFGTFSLKLQLTRLFGITGSVQTVFKAYEYNEAKNNITYTGGLGWIF